MKKKINFLNDPALKFGKLGNVADLHFEMPYALRKMRDEEIRIAEYERLAKELKANVHA